MSTSRIQSFSDSVMSVIITLTVFTMKTPVGTHLYDLAPLIPVLIVYAISFMFIGIYWNNHHHLFMAAKEATPRLMWRNLFLLFWLSLIPLMTAWLGENYAAPIPTALYGALFLLCALSFQLLVRSVAAQYPEGLHSETEKGEDRKGLITLTAYACSIPLAFVSHWISDGLFIFVALIWFIPDRRFEVLWRARG